MTEDEAKTKWCPFAKPVMVTEHDLFVRSFNERDDVDKIKNSMHRINDKCIGSECMAWRWIDLDVRDFGAVGDYNQETREGTDDTEAFQRAIDAERHGYCGLAGKL